MEYGRPTLLMPESERPDVMSVLMCLVDGSLNIGMCDPIDMCLENYNQLNTLTLIWLLVLIVLFFINNYCVSRVHPASWQLEVQV